MDQPRVSVIIVNFNAGDRLRRCLAHLGAQTFRAFEVLLVDNASTDGSTLAALSEVGGLNITVLEPGDNLGFAAANNLAARAAKGDWLALLNPDAYAEPNWLEQLLAASERYPDIDAFGSLQIDALDPTRLDGAGDVVHASGIYYRGSYGAPVATASQADMETFAPCAAAALWRRERFDALGGFEERFFCYGEDVDLGYRHRLQGGRCVQVAEARVLHEGSGLTGARSDFSIYHGVRNRFWVFVRDTPGWLFAALTIPHALATLAFFARAIALGEGAPYARALRDGLGGLSPTFRERRRIQSERSAQVADIAAAMSWSLSGLFGRKPALKPLPPPAQSDAPE